MKILIIDSNTDYETMYRKKLLTSSCNIDFASSLLKAKKFLSMREYDLVMVSHIFKSSSGSEICDELLKGKQKIKLLILASGNHIKEISKLYKSKNISGVINKGLNAEDFSEHICSIISKDRPEYCKKEIVLTNVPSRS